MAIMAPNAAGRFAAKALGIDLDYRKEHQEPIQSGAASVSSVDTCKFHQSCYDRTYSYPPQMSNMSLARSNGSQSSDQLDLESNTTYAACFHSGTGFSITMLPG